MEKKIITISREFGSGGRTIGRMVAERLGIPFYDKELVDQIAVESGFAPKFVEEHGEHSPGKSILSYAFASAGVPGVMNGMSTADFLWHIQCNVILQLAEEGNCVIVGRCADYILKEMDNVVNVFVWADMKYRVERAINCYGLPEAKAQENIQKFDKRRANYYNYHANEKWGKASNYHISVRSDYVGIDTCVEVLKAYITKGE